MVDVFVATMVAIMLLFVFAAYLFLRRIATGFKEGMRQAKGDDRK